MLNHYENGLTLSYKGWRWCGCSCSKYSKMSSPGGLWTSVSSLDELVGCLSLNVILLNLCEFKFMRLCWTQTPSTPFTLLSASQSLLPALLVSLDDSASLSSPGLLTKISIQTLQRKKEQIKHITENYSPQYKKSRRENHPDPPWISFQNKVLLR